MSRWKLFRKSKEKKVEDKSDIDLSIEKPEEELMPEQELTDEQESSENIPVLEHRETLYSKGDEPKGYKSDKKDEYQWKRTGWESADTIEKNIDDLGNKGITSKSSTTENVEKKVDSIIEMKLEKHHRKPANVIYVVSKPQPGQVKGDWAVRSHGKIYSHHRQKENAIEAARKIAADKNATVLVQNTDGTFSEGFKPRAK